ncbi:MAG: hypothetical protein M1133_09385 [Armatimonadetes bacterium]|nr:hypothetical protein [Armatimonadota bacterium]
MTSKERIIAAWNGKPSDRVPLTTWCFGLGVPEHVTWQKNGRSVRHWYSLRMEHLHTLPEPWELEDDFKRVLAWHSLGVDDILDVSVPWGTDPEMSWTDSHVPACHYDKYPILLREYQTPSGPLRHAVRQTGEDTGTGWVVQPDHVPLFEDYNIPRAVDHIVSNPNCVSAIRHLYTPPDDNAREWFAARMAAIRPFADQHGVPVQAWSAFGMDGAVWLTGTQGAILMALDAPNAFAELLEIIAKADRGRTELAASTPGVDMVVQRGWYSSVDFWSPALFEEFVYPHVCELVDIAHRNGVKFGYVMTTGVGVLGHRLADAGVDVLYFVDPVQDGISLEKARELDSRMTLVGGTNALSLASGDQDRIREEVRCSLDVLGPGNRFILHPVDAIFPDTPWDGVEAMIEAWQDYR